MQEAQSLSLGPYVVAAGEAVSPGVEQFLGCSHRHSVTGGGVFTVHDNEVGLSFTGQLRKKYGQGSTAWTSHNISKK